MYLDFVSVHKNTKRELGQYPAILISHLVNNRYLSRFVVYLGLAKNVLVHSLVDFAFSAFLSCCCTQHWKYFLFPLAR